jgi:hypothetical protein
MARSTVHTGSNTKLSVWCSYRSHSISLDPVQPRVVQYNSMLPRKHANRRKECILCVQQSFFGTVEGALAPHRFSFAEAGSVYGHRTGFGATCASKSVLSCLPLGLQLLKPWRKRLIGWSIAQRVIQSMAHSTNKEWCTTSGVTRIPETRSWGPRLVLCRWLLIATWCFGKECFRWCSNTFLPHNVNQRTLFQCLVSIL